MGRQKMLNYQLLDRDDIIDSYERSLRDMKWSALQIALLHAFNRFLVLCAITWATVVLLGAFAQDLETADFYFVSGLLLVEAARLFTTVFFSKLVTRSLVSHSADPERLKYTDDQPKRKASIGKAARFIEALLICLSLYASIYRLLGRNYEPKAPHLMPALIFFYVLVLANSLLGAVCLFYTILLWIFVYPAASISLERYRDTVFERALNIGLLEAHDFDFFAFTFKKLSQDYARNVQPLTVKKHNGDLIKYLYAHRKGVEVVCQYLESNDTFEQQAAANMVGFWAEEKGIATQTQMLTRLADKVGIGQTGWAAANSFSLLAKHYPESVAGIRDRNGRTLVEILLPLLENSNSMILVLVRILVSLFEKENIVNNMETSIKEAVEERLRRIFYENKRHRTRTLAAHALKLLGRMGSEDWERIGSIDPCKDSYFWLDEKEMVDDLYKEAGLQPYKAWHKLDIRSA